MSYKSSGSLTARPRSRRWILASSLLSAAFLVGCKPAAKPQATQKSTAISTLPTHELVEQLASARVDQAKAKLEQKRPGEALTLLVSALRTDPASAEARNLAEGILTETAWNLPVLTINHKLPIDQIAFAAPGSLWVSLGGDMNTTVRWNLETLQIEAVLFPATDTATRSLVFGPPEKSVVIQRGPVNLLCDALTLKPVCDLGALPDFVTPAATVVFSPEGLLVAHPGFASEKDPSIVWRLRDVATGQILRSSDPAPADTPRPLAAYLSREKLRVLRADGSVMEMPVSPVEPQQTLPLPEPVKLLNAQFSKDGNAVLTLQEQGTHERPALAMISYQDAEDGSLELKAIAERFPWSRQPNIWNGLMVDLADAPYLIDGNSVNYLTGASASVEVRSAITAAAFDGDNVLTGEESGCLTVNRLLPLPGKSGTDHSNTPFAGEAISSFAALCESLSGVSFDDKARSFTRLGANERFKSFSACDFDAIHTVFPRLDFQPVINSFKRIHPRSAPPEALLPLWDRLARSDLTGKSWPAILKLSEDLADTPWHRQLAAAVHGKSIDQLAATQLKKVFESGDDAAVLAAIKQAGNRGSAAATALALALKSDHAGWIRACQQSTTNLPPFITRIAASRADWLDGHRANALSPWPEDFPDLKEIRLREDWDGWEQADFEPALEAIHQCVRDELLAIELPENSTEEQRKAVAKRLADPETVATIGKPRFAIACMKAALAFSSHKEDSETTFNLANTARNLGAPAEPCMRAEALALTAMGEYVKAHPIWIELITEHPLETQIPGDYAEAAYTAFENADPQQAMTILTTGMHRYPQDGNFALRAGWVALLTGNAERGYQFLQSGKRIGFPKEKEENATALLTIAAAQNGFFDDARVYFNDLLRIDPAWGELKTLDTLDWPEELKGVLGQFMH